MKKLFYFLLAGSLLAAGACKKEDPAGSTPTPTPQPKPLCDGSSSPSYFPLAMGNSWSHGSGVSSRTGTVKETVTFGGVPYFRINYPDGFSGPYDRYYRANTAGDIYRYYESRSMEYMVVPANPTVGQEWDVPPVLGGDNEVVKMKVISTTATVKTASCEYKDVVEIHYYDQDGSVNTKYFYKKGLGLVRETVFSNSDLTAVTLK